MKKILEFCGTPELLIALLYSDDVCQTIKSQVMASGKVSMFVFAEDEPCYTPDSDDIRPQGNLGEPVQLEDDLRFCDVMERDNKESWSEEDEERAGIIATNGNDGEHYNDPEYQKEIKRYRNSKHTDDCLADDMSAHVIGEIKLTGSYRTPEHMGPRPAVHFRPDLTSEEIAMLEGRGDDSEVVGV